MRRFRKIRLQELPEYRSPGSRITQPQQEQWQKRTRRWLGIGGQMKYKIVSADVVPISRLAVDAGGKGHEPVWPSGEGYLTMSALREMMGLRVSSRLVFPGMEVAQLRELRFQVQPYLWTEFRDVSLQPGRQTQVKIVNAQDK